MARIGYRKSGRSGKKRMLIIVNPYATTVSDRLKNLVVYALQGRFEVETVATEAQNHATEIGREVRDHGYDVVVAFGGDGTLNEVANGLAGTDVPVSVAARRLDQRRLPHAGDPERRGRRDRAPALARRRLEASASIDMGRADERHFVFSCGVGIDATVVKRVDAHPKLKSRAGPYYYTWAAISSFYRDYMRNAVRLRVETDVGGPTEGVTALAQNSDPFTYFASRPVRVCEGVAIDDGTLSLGVLERATQRDMPTLIPRLFSEARPGASHRRIEHFDDVTEASIASTSLEDDGTARPFPVQVDGDYIGESTRLELRAEPGALTIIA